MCLKFQRALCALLHKGEREFAEGQPQDPCWREDVCIHKVFPVEDRIQTQGPALPPGSTSLARAVGGVEVGIEP